MSTRSNLWIAVKMDLDGVLVDSALLDNKASAFLEAIEMASKEKFGENGPFPIDELGALQRNAEASLKDDGSFYNSGHMYYIAQPRRIWG